MRALPAYSDEAGVPVDVVQPKVHNLARSQAESSQGQQDRIVPPAVTCVLASRPENGADLFRREKSRDARQRPLGNGRDAGCEIRAQFAAGKQVPKKGTQAVDYVLRANSGNALRLILNETDHLGSL